MSLVFGVGVAIYIILLNLFVKDELNFVVLVSKIAWILKTIKTNLLLMSRSTGQR